VSICLASNIRCDDRQAKLIRENLIPLNSTSNEAPKRSRFVSGRIGISSIGLLAAGMLGLVVVPPVFGQAPAGDSTNQLRGAGQAETQQSADPNPSGTANPATTSPAGNQNQSLAVNPLTGLVSASASDYHRLNGKERWQLYWRQNYWSVGAYFGPFLTALVLDQATGSPSEWGGGFPGYGRRVASRTAMAMVQGTLQASAAAALHEDVRYISSAQTGFRRRALHAIAYSFVTYDNEGHTTLNVANLANYYATTAISTAWVPGRNNVAAYTLTNGTAQVGLSVPINLVQEFWPEIRHRVLRRP
jgi:hypothetical protein